MRRMRTRTAVLPLLLGGLMAFAPTSASAAPSPESTADWKAVSVGNDHVCAIRTSGRAYCWGDDFQGELGDGVGDSSRDLPGEVAGGFTDWVFIDTGSQHTCGRRSNGHIYCWGGDNQGQLGNGAGPSAQFSPQEVDGNVWSALSVGQVSTCGIRAGHLYCWGYNFYGALGDGTTAMKEVPTEVLGGFTDWTAVSTGLDHSCGRRANGRLYCWGEDGSGQLGTAGPNAHPFTPTLVSGGITNWVAISVGGESSCARRANGHAYCWGDDGNGEVGDGTPFADRLVPTEVAGHDANWTTITTNGDTTCGRRGNGHLYCWGADFGQQRGDGPGSNDRAAPGAVSGAPANNWSATVSVGASTTCAIRTTKRLYCWGSDSNGKLGNGGNDVTRNVPFQVS